MELKDLNEINGCPYLKKAVEIMLRDHRKFIGTACEGTIEVRVSYRDNMPVAVEDYGKEKHAFKK